MKKKTLKLEPDSQEYRIAVMQLSFIEKIASERPLTYEETKIYDLLCKNLFLSKRQTEVNEDDGKPKSIEMDDTDLIKILHERKDKESNTLVNMNQLENMYKGINDSENTGSSE